MNKVLLESFERGFPQLLEMVASSASSPDQRSTALSDEPTPTSAYDSPPAHAHQAAPPPSLPGEADAASPAIPHSNSHPRSHSVSLSHATQTLPIPVFFAGTQLHGGAYGSHPMSGNSSGSCSGSGSGNGSADHSENACERYAVSSLGLPPFHGHQLHRMSTTLVGPSGFGGASGHGLHEEQPALSREQARAQLDRLFVISPKTYETYRELAPTNGAGTSGVTGGDANGSSSSSSSSADPPYPAVVDALLREHDAAFRAGRVVLSLRPAALHGHLPLQGESAIVGVAER